jgi:hypothetical protein
MPCNAGKTNTPILYEKHSHRQGTGCGKWARFGKRKKGKELDARVVE